LVLTLVTADAAGQVAGPRAFVFTPRNGTGIYKVGETVGWTIARNPAAAAAAAATTQPSRYAFVLRKNNHDVIRSGEIDLSGGSATVEETINEPAMVYLELSGADGGRPLAAAGAAVAPTELRPDADRPTDFDSFWEAKVAALRAVPANPVLTPGNGDHADVDYATITMDNVNGAHIHGQIAKPKREGKFPAVVIFQWASPPYPLQKAWVTQHAAAGWLALNIEPHDVLPDQPKSYYDALPTAIKHYESIGNDDRDKSYFVQMYLADYRAVDYIASRPDWDGKTLVVMGGSMGGQQSLCVAGLHPKITHVLVTEPAGCDTNADHHGRQEGYPNFPSNNSKVMQTALYVDPVNFTPHITATTLVAMGFIDTTAPPAGIWTAFNQIKAPKEAVAMIDAPHNHLATLQELEPYAKRSAQWLDTLVKGGEVQPAALMVAAAAPAAPPATAPAARPGVDDHPNMMQQLGLKSLRPGANPNNQAIFDESKANRFADSMPDVLKMQDGTRVTSADQWPKRRAELVELFEREIYGRIPPNVPKVTWTVTATTNGMAGNVPTVTKALVGHVDNSAYPELSVNIETTFTVPAGATRPVPIMLVFGGFFRPGGARGGPGSRPAGFNRPQSGTPWTQQAIAHGWGYGTINPVSIQPDNDRQLRAGVIGLTNKGQPRTPEQWGALRAWGWGVSQMVDYFEAHPDAMVDPTKVGIEGVSRYGKAALVTEAFDPRIAVALVASSGEGGAKLHRHVFGEAVENLAGGGAYHWMAGNFIKYAASDPPMTTADLPIDAHELIALCAPRPCFISYGSVQGGDPNWVDAHGSFMAGVLASPVYELLGKKGLGVTDEYLTAPMPPVKQLIGGDLAWRQHEGGHDVTPNWPTFFEWVANYISAPPLPPAAAATQP
jgi:cephalosporin-C deacetylase-like acetyl esterase